MSGLDDVTVFVNTVDSYQDCWEPFFTLLRTYWPEVPQPVVLNTERAEFRHPGLDIVCTRTARDEPEDVNLYWGERLGRGLAQVRTPLLVYLVEDAFLERPPRRAVLQQIVDLVREERLDCVRLTEPDGAGPYQPSPWPELWEVDRDAEYLASLHAAVWRTRVLRSLVRPRQNPWQFETVGGRRIRSSGHRIHAVNRDLLWHDPSTRVLPYDPTTGITMAQWNERVVAPLFAAHGIAVDLAERGVRRSSEARGPVRRVRERIEGKLRTLLPGWR